MDCSNTQTQTPPSYCAQVVGPPPCYSCKLLFGEQLIQETRSLQGLARGTFKKRCGGIVAALTEQEDDATIPTYGRQSSVNGAVALDNREGTTEVTVKLLGRMYLHIPVFKSCTVTLVDQRQTLWSCLSIAGTSSVCPETMPFSFVLPSAFKDGNTSYPLPPSFDLACLGPSGLKAVCNYTLEIKAVGRGIGRWTKVKKMVIPMEFMPRSRPASFSPVPDVQLIRCALKTLPGEWYESLTTIPSRSPKTLPPVSALIFIPSIRAFAYSETIPFYVQLSGPRCSLSSLSGHSPTSPTPPTVRVSLLRQCTLLVGDQKDWQNHTLSQGVIRAVSPPVCNPAGPWQDSLDWQGTIQVPKDLRNPSFFAGRLSVKDFLVLSVAPAEPVKAAFGRHQLVVPVKIVTDSWTVGEPAT
ncbi:hypothetical protein E1B28_012183 [Marasmius oreades]|uniref:Uncharacterized protein n=1 Tax=Marasmius oreades TaxID=181124 RepID=A0A9P7RRY8_9AGAR|nr:uncharacterized protein E1B28_012183 [Marasmius oreades]KAG7088161.1 hypothetical protein E1B28_012183 [Marasmius oreades]